MIFEEIAVFLEVLVAESSSDLNRKSFCHDGVKME